jgi:hypothetical protein
MQKEVLDELERMLDKAVSDANKLRATIELLRGCCEHRLRDGYSAFENRGSDGHYDLAVCSLCGKVVKH